MVDEQRNWQPPGAVADGVGETSARTLKRDARFMSLARPDYEIDAWGVRPGGAPALAVFGGLLVAAAPFGAWLRITSVADAGGIPEVTREVVGRHIGGGPVLAVVGLLSVVVALGWMRSSPWPRRLAHVVVLATAMLAGVTLLRLQSLIGSSTAQAIEEAGFSELNAGAGWGAWAALVGAGALVVSSALAAMADPVAATTTTDGGR